MSNPNILDVAIIGSGPAGYTAAIYAARAGLNPILFTGAQPGGQLTITTDVENYPGYPEGIMGPQMMTDFMHQAKRFGTEIRFGSITSVELHGEVKKLILDEKEEIFAHTVIISTGASAKWLGIENEQKFNGHGVSACAVCDGFFYRGQEVAIVGGGDTACEEASYLSKLASKVYMLVRGSSMRASQIMQKRVLNNPNIEVLWNSETAELLGDNLLSGIKVRNRISNEISQLDVTGFFVAIGHEPNTSIFKGQLDMDDAGYLKTVPGRSYTNIEGVFACGDAQDHIYRQAVTAAGTGCMAALDAERYLAEKETA